MRVCVLGSGSKGNSFYVEHNGTSLLIDVGFAASRMIELLHEIRVHSKDIKGILITHEHIDHVSGLVRFSKDNTIPVFMNSKTHDAIAPYLNGRKIEKFEQGVSFSIGTIAISPFSVSHDAADPSGFCLEAQGRRACIVTDIGHVTTLVHERLHGCNTIFLESNHDEDLLLHGKYPWYLKQRILSNQGHLSNLHARRTIERVATSHLKQVVLIHLSQENNTPELARQTVSPFLTKREINLAIADQFRVSDVFEV